MSLRRRCASSRRGGASLRRGGASSSRGGVSSVGRRASLRGGDVSDRRGGVRGRRTRRSVEKTGAPPIRFERTTLRLGKARVGSNGAIARERDRGDRCRRGSRAKPRENNAARRALLRRAGERSRLGEGTLRHPRIGGGTLVGATAGHRLTCALWERRSALWERRSPRCRLVAPLLPRSGGGVRFLPLSGPGALRGGTSRSVPTRRRSR